MNNSYDRDFCPQDQLDAERARTRHEALNVLALMQQKEHMKKTRQQAVRAQYIEPTETF